MRRTKIVCTIGPASRSVEQLDRLVAAGIVGGDDGHGVGENVIEPIGEQPVDPRQVAGMLVGGPLRWTRPPFEQRGWKLAYERNDEVRSPLERVDDELSRVSADDHSILSSLDYVESKAG